MIFNQGFEYCYPFKVGAGALGIILFWKTYSMKWPSKWTEATLIGLLVAIVWVVLYPEDIEFNADFEASLFSLTTGYFILWSIFRALGAWVVVPIIEELVFRGYILSRIGSTTIQLNAGIAFSWIGLTVSSVKFVKPASLFYMLSFFRPLYKS